MANRGHIESDGEAASSDEVFSGRAHIITRLHSEQSDSSFSRSTELSSPQSWQNQHTQETSSPSSESLSLPPAEVSNDLNSKHNTDSLYSWSEVYGSLTDKEGLNSTVPSLNLDSLQESNLDYLRGLDGLKLDREPQVAYDTWVASKQRLRQQKQQLLKEKQQSEEEEHQRRKLLSKICYEQWLHKKAQKAAEQRLEKHMQMAAFQASNSAVSRSFSSSSRSAHQVAQEKISQEVQNWWHKKQEQKERQRQEKQIRLLKKAQEEQHRKQLAERAWQNWIRNVYEKPKPVPLNQGMDSLRSTVSKLYINPEAWQPLKM